MHAKKIEELEKTFFLNAPIQELHAEIISFRREIATSAVGVPREKRLQEAERFLEALGMKKDNREVWKGRPAKNPDQQRARELHQGFLIFIYNHALEPHSRP